MYSVGLKSNILQKGSRVELTYLTWEEMVLMWRLREGVQLECDGDGEEFVV